MKIILGAFGILLFAGCSMDVPSLLGEPKRPYRYPSGHSNQCNEKILLSKASQASPGCPAPDSVEKVFGGVKEVGFSNRIQVALHRVSPLPKKVTLRFMNGTYDIQAVELNDCELDLSTGNSEDLIFICSIPSLPDQDLVFILNEARIENECGSVSFYETRYTWAECDGKASYGKVYVNRTISPEIRSFKKEKPKSNVGSVK